MLVRVLKGHTNAYGDKFEKAAGDVYDHPSPKLLIARKKVEAATAPVRKPRKRKATARRKKA